MNSLNAISLIAPCGMNCAICMAYLRDENRCPGCRAHAVKRLTITGCRIKNCGILRRGRGKFCFSCDRYACKNLKHLDRRYRTKYNMSMIENLDNIKAQGIRRFVRDEEKRWACADCGGTVCVHRGYCYSCGKVKHQRKHY